MTSARARNSAGPDRRGCTRTVFVSELPTSTQRGLACVPTFIWMVYDSGGTSRGTSGGAGGATIGSDPGLTATTNTNSVPAGRVTGTTPTRTVGRSGASEAIDLESGAGVAAEAWTAAGETGTMPGWGAARSP